MSKKKINKKKTNKGVAAGLRAVILAGGKGTRLMPFTANFPKPLVPLGNKPVLEILINQLVKFGINDITLTLGHLSGLIRSYFDNRQRLVEKIKLQYVEEEAPTGTAGSIATIGTLNDTFIVMNGDLLTDLDFNELVRFHRKQKAMLTIATHKRKLKIDLGVLEFDKENRITSYKEKPEVCHHVSMGVYVYEPGILKFIRPGCYMDFPDLVLKLLKNKIKVCAYQSDCLWLDIGRPDDYARAQALMRERGSKIDYV